MTSPGIYNYGVYNGGFYNIGAGHGDYPLNLDTFERVSVSFSTAITEREDGTEKRINLTPIPIHTFQGTHRALTNSEVSILRDFFDTKKGALTAFDFVTPDSLEGFQVRFIEDGLAVNRRTDSLWEVRVILKEVL